MTAKFAKALNRKLTVGWGDAFVDFGNTGNLDLILANGAIPVTNLKQDTEPLQVLQGLPGARFTNATGIIDPNGMPKIIGRGLAPADFDNNGRMAIAINTIGGPLVLLEDTGPVGHWLDVSLKGFQAGAVLTATLPNGRRLVQELHDGSSYLSSADPRAHFGLGDATQRGQTDDPLARRPRLAPREHRREQDHHGRAASALKPVSGVPARWRGRPCAFLGLISLSDEIRARRSQI